MNIIVATSRGRGLREIMSRRENTILSVHPGANLELLEDEALQLLDDVSDNTDTHVYFVAGLPDVTQRLKRSFYLWGRYRKYDEVTMPDFDAEKITKDIVSKYESTAVKKKKTNVTPVFCTICPMSLATWNRRRLSQHRTAYLYIASQTRGSNPKSQPVHPSAKQSKRHEHSKTRQPRHLPS